MTKTAKPGFRSLTVSDATYAKLQEAQTKLNTDFVTRLGLSPSYKVEVVSLSAVIDMVLEKFLQNERTDEPVLISDALQSISSGVTKLDKNAQITLTEGLETESSLEASIPFKAFQNDIRATGHEYPEYPSSLFMVCICRIKQEEIESDKCHRCKHPKIRHDPHENRCLSRDRFSKRDDVPVSVPRFVDVSVLPGTKLPTGTPPKLVSVSVPTEKELGRCECKRDRDQLYELSTGIGDRTQYKCPDCSHTLRYHQRGTPWACGYREK